MRGSHIVSAVKKKFAVKTDRDLSRTLGNTVQALHGWKNRPSVTARQIAGLIFSASVAAGERSQAAAIRPIVEFFALQKNASRKGVNFDLFNVNADGNGNHPYLEGLRDELQTKHGVYIFFDSRGQAIYAGKARSQSLWKEMKLAFNRNRGAVQKIKRVRHPARRVAYRTSDEKSRQINDYIVPLHELATYFSAYDVSDGMINSLEALLVRSFANDLLNVRMERFAPPPKKKGSGAKRKGSRR